MKKLIILVLAVVLSSIINGQGSYETILKAKALMETGSPDLAADILTIAINGLKDSRLYLYRAEAYTLTRDYSQAIADYSEANKLTPHSGEYGLSRIYALKGDASTSMYHLELNLKSSFKKGEKEVMLDPAFDIIENKPEWRQFWKKDWYTVAEQSISEIEYYISKGKNEEAKDILNNLKNSPENSHDIKYAEALVNLASGKYTEVLKTISILIDEDPENIKYLNLLALTQEKSSNPSGASVTYSKLLNLEVEDAGILLQRAECYRKTGETAKAIADIGKVLDIYPADKNALRLAGKVEALSGDNLKALEYFSANLKLYPNDSECYIDRANAYLNSKSWEWAMKDYSMSLDLDPKNSETWLKKGIALLNSGLNDEACHDFRKSLSLGNKRATEYISHNCIK